MIDIEASPDLSPEDDEAADRVIVLAESLGVDPVDLYGWVHDAAARYASDECNSSDDAAYGDAAYDEAGRQAADLNNSGLRIQIRYLVAQYGATKTEDVIRDAAGVETASA
ncbi:hypothetical protein ACIQZB_00360 [Streptomyces sp. NPDC097727]|uniref:hypothetical protein n=1 Tax=Streptomyces sp. NPDC097727 TaxID=3366092 RepID=UPI0038008CDC